MFGWFKRQPRCDLNPQLRKWIDDRFEWLVSVFGTERLKANPTITPTVEFFPQEYEPSEAGARKMFERICGFMMVPAESLDFRVDADRHRPAIAGKLERPTKEWLGRYVERENKNLVLIDNNIIRLPETLIATLAHEISHELLLGNGHLSVSDDDHEFVTDLTVAFMGLGVFAANDSIENPRRINRRGEEIGRAGYLTPDAWAYALALRSSRRGEASTEWDQWLRRPLRTEFRTNLRYLNTNPNGTTHEPGTKVGAETEDVENLAESSAAPFGEDSGDEELELTDDDHVSILLLDAHELANTKDWETALSCLNEAIELIPDEPMAFQQRALTFIELGRFADALADGERSVTLAPDEFASFLARGSAALHSKNYPAAIADFITCTRLTDVDSPRGMMETSRALWLWGMALTRSNEFGEAIDKLTESIAAWHDWPEPYEARAEAFRAIGEPERAERDQEEAIRREKG